MLTDKQKNIFEYIKSYYINKGIAPSMSEISEAFHISISNVQRYYRELILKGYIQKPFHKTRSIKIPSQFLNEENENIDNTYFYLGDLIVDNTKMCHLVKSHEKKITLPISLKIKQSEKDFYSIIKILNKQFLQYGLNINDLILIKVSTSIKKEDTILLRSKETDIYSVKKVNKVSDQKNIYLNNNSKPVDLNAFEIVGKIYLSYHPY